MVLVDVEQGAAAEGARRRGGSSRGLATRGGGLASLELGRARLGMAGPRRTAAGGELRSSGMGFGWRKDAIEGSMSFTEAP
mgnify:CR=1 FL=1